MTDNAERKVREWAKGRNGDPITNKDVVELVLAVDDDGEARHVETIQRIDDVDERHISLCLRVSELEQTSISCSERVKAYVTEEHDLRHRSYVDSLSQSQFQGKLVWFFATTIGKVALVVAGLIAGILLNIAVYGRP